MADHLRHHGGRAQAPTLRAHTEWRQQGSGISSVCPECRDHRLPSKSQQACKTLIHHAWALVAPAVGAVSGRSALAEHRSYMRIVYAEIVVWSRLWTCCTRNRNTCETLSHARLLSLRLRNHRRGGDNQPLQRPYQRSRLTDCGEPLLVNSPSTMHSKHRRFGVGGPRGIGFLK